VNHIPILRKEFVIDDYQIIEAKSYGADAILLIAAVLTTKELADLYGTAHNLGLEVLVEVHTEEEVLKINGNADLVGINNRNLKDFTVDIDNSIRLAEKLPSSMPKVAESGINSPETIKKLKSHGFHGFLIGESFMKTENPGKSFGEFVKAL
jgi:indole-3-glycerol phosphate synthase